MTCISPPGTGSADTRPVGQLPLALPPEGLLHRLQGEGHGQEHRHLGLVQQERHRISSSYLGLGQRGTTPGVLPVASVASAARSSPSQPFASSGSAAALPATFATPSVEERPRPLVVPVLQMMKRDRDLDQPLERRPHRVRRPEPGRLEQLVHLEEEPVIRERRRPAEKPRQVVAVPVLAGRRPPTPPAPPGRPARDHEPGERPRASPDRARPTRTSRAGGAGRHPPGRRRARPPRRRARAPRASPAPPGLECVQDQLGQPVAEPERQRSGGHVIPRPRARLRRDDAHA